MLQTTTSRLQEVFERVDGEAGVTHDTAHGEGVNGIVAGDGQNTDAVGHDDVLALAGDTKISFLQGTNGIEVVDARPLAHD